MAEGRDVESTPDLVSDDGSVSVTWRGAKSEVTLKGLLSDSHFCSIMHEPTCNVEIMDMSNAWLWKDTRINTVLLPCSHVFHPSALAQHFAYRDMRCPVCRNGACEKMNLRRSDVPSHVSQAIREAVQEMNVADEEEDEVESHQVVPEMDSHMVRSMLSLYAEIFVAGECFLCLNTRLIPSVNGDETESSETFSVHRSFQRLLFSNLMRFSETPSAAVRFCVLHPILMQPVMSPVTSIHEIHHNSRDTALKCNFTGDEILATVRTSQPESSMQVSVNVFAIKSLCLHSISAHMGVFIDTP